MMDTTSALPTSVPEVPAPDSVEGIVMTPEIDEPPGILRSTLANWVGEIVMILSGFVLPRLIEQTMSRAELGIWDFGWSMRAVITLSDVGMSSAVGYHVARIRTARDWKELNPILSATLALVIYNVILVAIATFVVIELVPRLMLMDRKSPQLIEGAQWMVAAMGFAASAQMVSRLYAGVLTGSHRFDWLTASNMIADVFVVVATFVAVLAGWGLKIMALCIAARQILDIFLKRAIARKMYPEMRLWPRWVDRARFREIATYSGKTTLETTGAVLINQCVPALLMHYSGAEAVALFSRPMSLLRISTRLVTGFARVLVPKAGELSVSRSVTDLRRLLIRGSEWSFCLALPLSLVWLILGKHVMQIWMGNDYAVSKVLIILTLCYLPYLTQRGTWHVLMGMGSHGKASMATLTASGLSLGLSYLLIGRYNLGLTGAALGLALPLAALNLFVLPYFGCKVANMGLLRFWFDCCVRVVPATIPFAVVLLAARYLFAEHPFLSLLAGFVVGSPVLAFGYWRWVFTDDIRRKLRKIVRNRWPVAWSR